MSAERTEGESVSSPGAKAQVSGVLRNVRAEDVAEAMVKVRLYVAGALDECQRDHPEGWLLVLVVQASPGRVEVRGEAFQPFDGGPPHV